MSRPTDTLRGARMAMAMAEQMLNQVPDLFPIKLTKAQRELWVSIRDRAQEAIELESWAVLHG